MTVPPPRRPWRKRKRTWAAVSLWLAAAYPLSMWPACYCLGRRWIDNPHFHSLYGPVVGTVDAASISEWEAARDDLPWWRAAVSDTADGYFGIALWCGKAGRTHRRAGPD